MEKRKNIVQYRERLDKTLASFDLTNDQKLRLLVESQVRRDSQSEIELEGYAEKLEIKTAELSNFLDMVRSASADENGGSSPSDTDWKLKQDNEEFRVMYRVGPEGTPYHTLLVEGYVDGPVDVSLCLSWESTLYKKWWPQFTIPTFKVTASDCLQKVQTGEQIALVRMKPPWPLSTREAIVHYYLFEYFQDDLIVVLLKSVAEPEKINDTIDGFNKDVIPEANGVVRIDLVGGYVIQKVTSERSYFRTIANLDIKVDFMPPSLVNFISRQLIGSGFRLYQKAVASMMNNDREFSKALTDSLYVRIREALYNTRESNFKGEEERKQVASILPAEELIQSKQDSENGTSREGRRSNQNENSYNSEILDAGSEESVQREKDINKLHEVPMEEGGSSFVLKGNTNCEIVDADSEENIVEANIDEIVQIENNTNKEHDISIEYDDTRDVQKRKSNVYINSNVKQALETLERAISAVRKYEFPSRRFSFTFANEAAACKVKGDEVDQYSAKLFQPSAKNDIGIPRESSDDLYEIQNLRHTGTDPILKEVNYNKVVLALPNQNLSRPNEASQVDSYLLKTETTLDQILCDNKEYTGSDMSSDDPIKSSRQKKINNLVTQGISSDVPKKLNKRKNYRYCCFSH
ncbi:unnamed protein product [Vicia faba]|uniref:START domain-containing protein n=1 Tax=Vicia faba TaxID=3906 RepID=A0AAV1B0K6_VICFA|nr:unnamed protein product [Vicia faba]